MCSQSVYPPSKSQAGDLGKEQKSVKQIETKSMKYPVIPTKPRAARTTQQKVLSQTFQAYLKGLCQQRITKVPGAFTPAPREIKYCCKRVWHCQPPRRGITFNRSPSDLPSIVTVPQLRARHCNYVLGRQRK